MQNHLYQKVKFRCGGCGRTAEREHTHPARAARSALFAPPAEWTHYDVTKQDKVTGAIGTLVVFFCSEECKDKTIKGDGVAVKMIRDFAALLTTPDLTAPALKKGETPHGA